MEAGANRLEITANTGEDLEKLMTEEQDKKKERKQKISKEELKGVEGAGCGCEDVPELSESELKNVSGGVDLAAVAIPMYDDVTEK